MHHPIPRFTNIPIIPIPDRPPRFHEAEQAIAATLVTPRPPELDSHIGWFPHVPKASEKHHNTQGGGRQQRRKK